MGAEIVHTYKDLVVWQRAIELVVETYSITDSFPKSEQFGLVSQMRRAAVSIPSNIAEGRRRGTLKDFRHFLLISYGSGAELETQIEIAKKLPLGASINFIKVDQLLQETMKMLNTMLRSMAVV